MLTWTQYRILRTFFPGVPDVARSGGISEEKSKLTKLLGGEFFASIRGKVVVDFGCGEGLESIEMAQKGARRVIGVDIREELLRTARKNAVEAGVGANCLFATAANEPADIVVSVDAFEHFADPAAILRIMDSLLKPEGEVVVSFGPAWYHPMGGHLFSVFPWAHLIFSEKALIRWRSDFKSDGARRFGEVAGGLNQMTIGRFEKLIAASPFRFSSLELAPIRQLRRLHGRLTREFTTAVVRCRLVKRS